MNIQAFVHLIIQSGKPPALLGNSHSLTVPGVSGKVSLTRSNCGLRVKETQLKDIGSLSHTKWECKYHVVFIPKYRRKAMEQELR
jgi:hypothetical protein